MKRALWFYPEPTSSGDSCTPATGVSHVGQGYKTAGDIAKAVRRLETDKTFRDAFFSEPILLPSARAWVHGWCQRTTSILWDAIQRECARVGDANTQTPCSCVFAIA